MPSLEIRLNGVLAAYQRDAGYHSARTVDPDERQQANTSASLIVREGETVLEHHLLDVGEGVVENLNRFAGPWPLHSVVLTHGHFDHVVGLNSLANGLKRARESGQQPVQPLPLPVYCTPETWAQGPQRLLPALSAAEPNGPRIVHQPLTPGRSFSPGDFGGLLLTPLPVIHYQDSVMYVVQFWRKPIRRAAGRSADYKILLCWDLQRFPRLGDTKATAGHDYQPGLDQNNPLLQGADLLIIECNTWRPHQQSGHTSFIEIEPMIALWRPRQTRVVHYSGWEDRPAIESLDPQNSDPRHGPVTAANLALAMQSILGPTIDAGYAGESFHFGRGHSTG